MRCTIATRMTLVGPDVEASVTLTHSFFNIVKAQKKMKALLKLPRTHTSPTTRLSLSSHCPRYLRDTNHFPKHIPFCRGPDADFILDTVSDQLTPSAC